MSKHVNQQYYYQNNPRQRRQLNDNYPQTHSHLRCDQFHNNQLRTSSGGQMSRQRMDSGCPDSGLINMLSGFPESSQPVAVSDDSSQDALGPVIENEEKFEEHFSEREIANKLLFNSSWIFSEEYLQNSTPSRRHGISFEQEMDYRRKGTTFIRDMTKLLKHKLICKETAYMFFHRFFMLRSFKQFEPIRMALACFYLACKYEDHPLPKEHLIQVFYMLVNNQGNQDNAKTLSKEDKEYIEYCDRLISDENKLLQVLGFGSTIIHFPVQVVETALKRVHFENLYKAAFQVATEINRLTILCLQYPGHILASVSIYLAGLYKNLTLPDDWLFSITIQQENKSSELDSEKIENEKKLVIKIANQYRDFLASSQMIRKILSPEYINRFQKTKNINDKPEKSHSFGLLNNFSPDSAYSSSSSNAATYSPANIHGKSCSFTTDQTGSSDMVPCNESRIDNTMNISEASMNKVSSSFSTHRQVSMLPNSNNLPVAVTTRKPSLSQNATQNLKTPHCATFMCGPQTNLNISHMYDTRDQPSSNAAVFPSSVGPSKRFKYALSQISMDESLHYHNPQATTPMIAQQQPPLPNHLLGKPQHQQANIGRPTTHQYDGKMRSLIHKKN